MSLGPGALALWRFMEHETIVLVLGHAIYVFDPDSDEPVYWDVFGKIFEGSDPSVYVARECELTLAQCIELPKTLTMQEAAAEDREFGPSGAAVIDTFDF